MDGVRELAAARRGRLVAAIIAIAAIAWGCSSKKIIEPPYHFEYNAPSSPRNVLENLVKAYVMRDSTETAAVYDDAYVGTSTDPSAPVPTINFTKADEVHHVGRLKLDPNIVTVFLDLGNSGTWIRLPPDPGDDPTWAVIQRNAQTVRIEDISRATTWESSNNQMTYTFKPTFTGTPGESTWTIVKWTEYAN